MSKVASELRGLGVPKSQLNPYTSQLSRWNGRLNRYTSYKGRALRDFGRTARGIRYGAFFTGTLIADGFYNWWVIIEAAYDATSFEEEEGKNCG
jgi:hypothetical protein